MKVLASIVSTLTLVGFLTSCATAPQGKSKSAPATTSKSVSKSPEKHTDKNTEKKKVSNASAKAASDSVNEALCSKGNDQRTISLTTGPAGCKVIYTKGGNTQEIASARNQLDYCTNAIEKVKKNLTSSGFTCE